MQARYVDIIENETVKEVEVVVPDENKLCSDKTSQGSSNQTCYGHNAYDITFFKSTHKLEDGTYTQTHLTNWEVRQSQMVKGNYSLPYLYNHYGAHL